MAAQRAAAAKVRAQQQQPKYALVSGRVPLLAGSGGLNVGGRVDHAGEDLRDPARDAHERQGHRAHEAHAQAGERALRAVLLRADDGRRHEACHARRHAAADGHGPAEDPAEDGVRAARDHLLDRAVVHLGREVLVRRRQVLARGRARVGGRARAAALAAAGGGVHVGVRLRALARTEPSVAVEWMRSWVRVSSRPGLSPAGRAGGS